MNLIVFNIKSTVLNACQRCLLDMKTSWNDKIESVGFPASRGKHLCLKTLVQLLKKCNQSV